MHLIKIIAISILHFALLAACGSNKSQYKGQPFQDAKYTGGAQVIPGKLQCEYYDLGGEGVAFHDSDTVNSGSGQLNPVDGSYFHSFRIDEPVDISYTKSKGIDDNPHNFVEPKLDQLYVGWTEADEWIKYTVDVKKAGTYRLGLMYTARENGQISLSVNDVDATGPLNISSTYVATDTIAWRQWHHWNYADNLTTLELEAGTQVLTLHTVAVGQMNYDYLSFTPVAE